MSTASSGAARERRVSKYMQARGWFQVMRAASSKGVADLAMVHPEHGLAWVQVGTAKSKTLGPEDRNKLCALADGTGSLALLATSGPGVPTKFWVVTRGTASRWSEMAL